MNRAISDTNVILNTVSTSLWLFPSSLIILKNSIIRYNNRLKVASEGMKFGIYQSVNYVSVKKDTPKIINPIIPPIRHLDTLGDVPPKKNYLLRKKPKIPPKSEKKEVDSRNNDIEAIYAVAGVSSYLFRRIIRLFYDLFTVE